MSKSPFELSNGDLASSVTAWLNLIYLFASRNLCRIAAISALVALSSGLLVLSVLPFIKPLPQAHCIAEIAYSEMLSASV